MVATPQGKVADQPPKGRVRKSVATPEKASTVTPVKSPMEKKSKGTEVISSAAPVALASTFDAAIVVEDTALESATW